MFWSLPFTNEKDFLIIEYLVMACDDEHTMYVILIDVLTFN